MQPTPIGNGSITLRRSLFGLYRLRHLVLRVFGATMLIVTIATLFMKPIFRAESSLLVNVNRAKVLLSGDTNAKTLGPAHVSEEDLNSIVSMLRGHDLVREALQDAGNEDSTASAERGSGFLGSVLGAPVRLLRGMYYGLHGRRFPTPLDRQVETISREIEVLPVRKSNVIQVALQDADPVWASAFLNRLVEVFLDHYARTFDPSNAEPFFEEQSRMLSTKLAAAEDALRAFREQVGIVSIEEQRRSAVVALTEAQRELDKLTVDEASSRALLDGFSSGLKKENPLVLTARRQSQTAAEHAKTQVLGLETRRFDLLTKYTADSERVREVDAQLAVAREVLEREMRTPLEEQDYGINKTHERLSVEKALEQSRTGAMAARRTALATQVVEMKRRLQEFDANSIELEHLERDRKVNQEAYASYVQQHEAARLANALNTSQILNVTIATPATPPVTPVRPRVTMNLLLGALLGLCLGVATALVVDSFDTSLRSADDVTRSSGLDVLAMIPR